RGRAPRGEEAGADVARRAPARGDLPGARDGARPPAGRRADGEPRPDPRLERSGPARRRRPRGRRRAGLRDARPDGARRLRPRRRRRGVGGVIAGVLRLAWRSIAHYRVRSVLLVAAFALVFLLPLAVDRLVGR